MRKPDIIIKLEKTFNVKLIEYQHDNNNMEIDFHPINYNGEISFSRNEKNEILSLNLSNLQITDLSFIKDFPNLIALNLMSNKIIDVSYLEGLNNLTYINFNSNLIKDIQVLKNLKALKYVDFRNNKINDLSPLENLTSLIFLYLWNNEITDISSLKNLENLEKLDLGNNNISNINVLAKLNKIVNLDIGKTKITDLRPLESIISKSIEIYFNEDDYYGDHDGIFIYETYFTTPPFEVIEQGNETILQYFEDARIYGLRTLNECKLIFVGDGGLGKTSLMKNIVGLPFSKETTTHGINKKSWNEILNHKKEEIKVNLWDFGGQHIQHSLHQFFLTEKVIYILLLDPRNDNSAMYWLEQIEKLGKDSEVLIVYNWKDSKDRDSHNNKSFFEIRKKYPVLRNPFLLSCKSNEGFDDFKEELVKIILEQKDLLVKYPLNWFKIKEELELNVTINKNYISYNEYDTVCENNKYTNEVNKKNLLNQLNKIGSIVFFDKPILNDIQVLNPDWITTGAYSVITSEITRTRKGHLNYNDLKEIFKEEKYIFSNKKVKLKYKEKDFQFILALMTDYDLCVFNPFKDNEYLIPCAFEGEKPQELDIYKVNSTMYRFKFESSFEMLIMYRFMARNFNKCIKDGYWQSGIVIKDDHSETFALVETNQHSKIIDFWVKGENIREFWEVLRRDIKDINSKYSLDYKEEILYYDVEGGFDVFLSYSEMLDCLRNGVRIIPFHPVHEIFNLDVLKIIENFEDSKKIIKAMEKEGVNFNIKGDFIANGQTQIGGKNNNQFNYTNKYSNNSKIQELKDILEDFEDVSQKNKEWQANFTNALTELYRLEDAKDEIDEKKSISKLQKFFTKAKEVKDWVAISVLPAEIVTKGEKMIELGEKLFHLVIK